MQMWQGNSVVPCPLSVCSEGTYLRTLLIGSKSKRPHKCTSHFTLVEILQDIGRAWLAAPQEQVALGTQWSLHPARRRAERAAVVTSVAACRHN